MLRPDVHAVEDSVEAVGVAVDIGVLIHIGEDRVGSHYEYSRSMGVGIVGVQYEYSMHEHSVYITSTVRVQYEYS